MLGEDDEEEVLTCGELTIEQRGVGAPATSGQEAGAKTMHSQTPGRRDVIRSQARVHA